MYGINIQMLMVFLQIVYFFSSPTESIPPVPNVDQFSFSACREKVFQQLDCFNGIPFTVQRLCELLTSPTKHYKRTDKFMRALEKNMLIVSTIEPRLSKKSDDEGKSVILSLNCILI